MGGESKQTTQQNSKTEPWKPAQPALQGALGQLGGLLGQTGITPEQQQAYSNITQTAQGFQPQVQGVLSGMLGGGGIGANNDYITSGYDLLKNQLMPTAHGQFLDIETNPYLQGMITRTGDDIRNQIGSMFAGAGRSFSGAHMNALARGLADSALGLKYQAYGDERDRQNQALNSIFGGGLSTAGALDQSAANIASLQNRALGLLPIASTGDYAALQEASAPFDVQMGNLSDIGRLLVPIAGLGGTQSGTTTTTQKTDPLTQALGLASTAIGFL